MALSRFSQQDIVRQLKLHFKEDKSQANYADPITRKTKLHHNAEAGRDEVVLYLRKGKGLGIDIDPQDINGDTPLNAVIQSKTLFLPQKDKVIRELLAGGADANVPNNLKLTPLMNLYILRNQFDRDQEFGPMVIVSKLINDIQEAMNKKARVTLGVTLKFSERGQVIGSEALPSPQRDKAYFDQLPGRPLKTFVPQMDYMPRHALRIR